MTCGFTGSDRSRIFRIDGGLTGGKHTFKNLRFTNGKGASDTGGALLYKKYKCRFLKIVFYGEQKS